MQVWVPERTGAAYCWERALGGFRKADRSSGNIALRHPSFRAYADYMETLEFQAALALLLERAALERVAIMCSETVWWRCHRRFIADAAVLLHRAGVRHLMHDGKLRRHVPTAGVRVTENGTLRYDVLFEADAAGADGA